MGQVRLASCSTDAVANTVSQYPRSWEIGGPGRKKVSAGPSFSRPGLVVECPWHGCLGPRAHAQCTGLGTPVGSDIPAVCLSATRRVAASRGTICDPTIHRYSTCRGPEPSRRLSGLPESHRHRAFRAAQPATTRVQRPCPVSPPHAHLGGTRYTAPRGFTVMAAPTPASH